LRRIARRLGDGVDDIRRDRWLTLGRALRDLSGMATGRKQQSPNTNDDDPDRTHDPHDDTSDPEPSSLLGKALLFP
jgi:hypothetical protein